MKWGTYMKPTIKAFVFDVYGTLYDVHSMQPTFDSMFPEEGKSMSQTWRTKQLEYMFIRQIMGRYEDFSIITREALQYALSEQNVSWTKEMEQTLLDTYLHLTPYEETENILRQIQHKQTVILSNGSDEMLQGLLHHTKLDELFDQVISVDGVKQYKPSFSAYMYWFKSAGIRRDEVLFLSSNGWDIAGAKNFGFHTAWINRNDQPRMTLDLQPDAVYTDLSGILNWLNP